MFSGSEFLTVINATHEMGLLNQISTPRTMDSPTSIQLTTTEQEQFSSFITLVSSGWIGMSSHQDGKTLIRAGAIL